MSGDAFALFQNQPGIFRVNDVPKGKTLNFTISAIDLAEVGQQKEMKQVVAFKETPRKVVLNNTRLRNLVDLFGEEKLIGQEVGLTRGVVQIIGAPQEMLLFVEPTQEKD